MGIWVSCRRLSSYVATRFGRFTLLRWLGTAPVNNCCPNTASAQALRDSNVGRLAAVSRSEWFESGRGCCVESLDKALYSHCPKEKPSH